MPPPTRIAFAGDRQRELLTSESHLVETTAKLRDSLRSCWGEVGRRAGSETGRMGSDVSEAESDVRNLLTIDVEDWYQLVAYYCGRDGVDGSAALARQMDRLLELFAAHSCRATFFCLGRSMALAPHIVQRISDAGHEVATHGWGHQPVFLIGLKAFREDLIRSIKWIEDRTGKPVLGYRAPAFSVSPPDLEAFYDICFESGLRYDSSVFPIKGRRYGIPDAPLAPTIVRRDGDRTLTEFPLSTIDYLGRRWAVAGGGHWRLLPAKAILAATKHLNTAGRPLVTYMHPYEFDTERLKGWTAKPWSPKAMRTALLQNVRRRGLFAKLNALLTQYRFQAMEDYLNDTRHAST